MMQLADRRRRTRSCGSETWRRCAGLRPCPICGRACACWPSIRPLAPTTTARCRSSALQFVGAGKVVFHATDETHRWRFRVGDVYFARYWMQTIRYLCRSQAALGQSHGRADDRPRAVSPRRAVQLRVRFLDDRLAPARTTA